MLSCILPRGALKLSTINPLSSRRHRKSRHKTSINTCRTREEALLMGASNWQPHLRSGRAWETPPLVRMLATETRTCTRRNSTSGQLLWILSPASAPLSKSQYRLPAKDRTWWQRQNPSIPYQWTKSWTTHLISFLSASICTTHQKWKELIF